MGYDVIRLNGLQLSALIGVLDQEKTAAQPLVIDAELRLDLTSAGQSDDLDDTVSYAAVADLIEDIVTDRRFALIEALAETLTTAIIRSDARIEAAAVTVHKPQAPLTQAFDDVSVTIHRTRSETSESPALESPRQTVSGIYEGELVEDQTSSVDSPLTDDEGVTLTTPTAHLGHYDRTSLAELGHDDASVTDHYRDPDLPAAFPVRSVLALGSNLGDSWATLASAVRALEEAEDVVVVKVSPTARTKPVGGPAHQRDFLNRVVEIETRLSPHGLLDLAQRIEADHNRVREQRHGPRTLDVDIVTFASATIDSSRLQVPHPSAAGRAFVLLPWSWMDPVALLSGRPVRELAQEAEDYDDVVRLET
ncbi:2-amino-4-hydroxy-6-hydroxymethyldihydropteridine diphosphokinase [Nesterenkonia salmonea]|uniref:Bifunctional folate synthesis protein n=1 Tax=Nesterenkonia salmonea TaxID=1804987 RepID=A0A5R9BE61_9MICC|nr:2-amino-4-hydroxy-6-hydroxymethyldihydropteridine diphosphokinase [Nesterenkonia salmonea]TLP98481.1 2-amino-4-hydroxy-6-hydroxymethyldihydropteridine diphosphokinase [Nesterenkonia salmonea]